MVAPETATENRAAGILRIQKKLLTLADVRDSWSGITTLEVPTGSVVTPAVKDELRARGIVLTRFTSCEASLAAAGQGRLLVMTVAGTKGELMNKLGAAGTVQPVASDSPSALRTLGKYFAESGIACIWCSPRPFAALRETLSLPSVTAVQLGKLEHLSQAVEQVSPNTLVLNDSDWTASAVANLARTWTRSLAV